MKIFLAALTRTLVGIITATLLIYQMIFLPWGYEEYRDLNRRNKISDA